MEHLKPYFELFHGINHFKDELPIETHRAVETLILDGKMIAQQTLDGREEIIYESGKNTSTDPEIKRRTS